MPFRTDPERNTRCVVSCCGRRRPFPGSLTSDQASTPPPAKCRRQTNPRPRRSPATRKCAKEFGPNGLRRFAGSNRPESSAVHVAKRTHGDAGDPTDAGSIGPQPSRLQERGYAGLSTHDPSLALPALNHRADKTTDLPVRRFCRPACERRGQPERLPVGRG